MSMSTEIQLDDLFRSISNNGKEKLTIKEVADILGCCKEPIRKRVAFGEMKEVRIGRRIYIAKDWLTDYLQNGGGIRKNFYDKKCRMIVSFCLIPRSREEIRLYIGDSAKDYTMSVLRKRIAAKLMRQAELPHSNYQKYVAIVKIC